jgi:hypothetical protein
MIITHTEYLDLNFMHAEVYDNSLVSRWIMKKKETVIGVPFDILDKEVMTFTNHLILKDRYL